MSRRESPFAGWTARTGDGATDPDGVMLGPTGKPLTRGPWEKIAACPSPVWRLTEDRRFTVYRWSRSEWRLERNGTAFERFGSLDEAARAARGMIALEREAAEKAAAHRAAEAAKKAAQPPRLTAVEADVMSALPCPADVASDAWQRAQARLIDLGMIEVRGNNIHATGKTLEEVSP